MLRIDEKTGLFSFRHEAMATELLVSLGGVDGGYARQAAQAFFGRVDEIESKLSLYQEGSDVTRINLLDVGEQTRVSEECVDCLQLAMVASRLTWGRFHPFLGKASLQVKGEAPVYLKSLLKGDLGSGISAVVEVDPASRLVVKKSAGAILDFGGIGKGFALDLAMEEMEDWEVPVAMANFGGSTLLFRGSAGDEVWTGALGEEKLEPFRSGAFSSSGIGFQGEHIVGNSLCWERTFSRSESAALADALTTGAMLMDTVELEALCQAESGLALAAMGKTGLWGARRFCAWEV